MKVMQEAFDKSVLSKALDLLVEGRRKCVMVEEGREMDFASLYLIDKGYDYTCENDSVNGIVIM